MLGCQGLNTSIFNDITLALYWKLVAWGKLTLSIDCCIIMEDDDDDDGTYDANLQNGCYMMIK